MLRRVCSIGFVSLSLVLIAAPIAAGTLPIVTLTAPDGMAAEAGQDPATFTVTRSIVEGSSLFVYVQIEGTASLNVDYTGTNLNPVGGNAYFLAIPSGESSISTTLTPLRDNLIEGEEGISFTLLEPQTKGHEYTIGDPNAGAATISDDVAEVQLTVGDGAAAEAGQDPATVTITRNAQGNTAAVLFVYVQIEGTASLNVDYTATNLNPVGGNAYFLAIPSGESSIPTTLTPLRDNLIEGEEGISFTLLEPQTEDHDYTIGDPNAGAATISDDVAEVQLTVGDGAAAEVDQDPASVTITRNTQGNTAAVLFVYVQIEGTASLNVDYTATNLNPVGGNTYFVAIPAAALSQSVVVTPTFDETIEGNETVTFTLVAPQTAGHDYLVGMPSQGEITILDNVPAIIKDGFENLMK